MPDVTLYQNDAELICEAIRANRKAIRDNATKMIMPEADYNQLLALEELLDKMHDRLRQGLHPLKPD